MATLKTYPFLTKLAYNIHMSHTKTHYQTAKWLTESMDSKFKIGPWSFGLDPIIGLVPWVGDFIGLALSLYIFWIGIQMRVPLDKLAQMLGNIIFDFILGVIPLIGDLADFAFKANSKNMEILEKYAEKEVFEGEVV